MNPASITPLNLPDSRITLQAYRDDSDLSFRLHQAARRDRALAIGRLAVRLVAKLAALRPSLRPISPPLARWG